MASGQLASFAVKNVHGLATGEKKGWGAYGAVYKVTIDGIPCIAKRLHDILVDPQVPRRQRASIQLEFHDECMLLSQLRHPNVVHFVGVHFGSNQDDMSLIVECLDTDLARCLETQPNIPIELKLLILLDVSYGLLYLHTHSPQIIHRELTAANILLTRDKRAKIADLGVSKLFGRHPQAMMRTHVPDMLYYMPPEALMENPKYDVKLDIFSFGHLALYVINQVFPKVFEVRITPVVLHEGSLQIQKRQKAIDKMGRDHCLHDVVTKCLQDNSQKRPTTLKLNEMLNHLCMKHPREHEDMTKIKHLTALLREKDRQVAVIAAENDRLQEEVLSKTQLVEMVTKFRRESEEWQSRAAEWQARHDALEVEFSKEPEKLESTSTEWEEKQSKPTNFQDVAVQSKPDCQEVAVQTECEASAVEATGFFRGVEVIGETRFAVPNEGGSFEWKGYGLRLHVPRNSIPASMAECTINIKASLSGQFEFPEDSDLLSPVFWISVPIQFLKPVTLEIQHCTLIEDEGVLSDLRFMSAKCSQKYLPYIFRPVDGGVFTMHNSYASIQLTNFSGVGVFGRMRTPRSYCAHIYYSSKGIHNWRFYFIITRNLEIQIAAVREYYGQFANHETALKVTFQDSEIILDIPADGKITEDGWKITPLFHPAISREDADSFAPGQLIPGCELAVEWSKKQEQPTRLWYKVSLIGAKAPQNFFNLSIDSTWEGTPTEEALPHTRESIGTNHPTLIEVVRFRGRERRINVPQVIGTKYMQFGILLLDDSNGDRVHNMELKHRDNVERINQEILREWTNGNGKQPVSWETLIEVLHDVELSSLASEIKAVKTESVTAL